MTVAGADIHPTDLEGRQNLEDAQRRHETAVARQERADLAWLVSTPHGRRYLRRQLTECGFRFDTDLVSGLIPDGSHARMAFDEGMRIRGMQVLWPVLRMVAQGEIPFEHFVALMNGKDAR